MNIRGGLGLIATDREDTHYRCALVGALQHQANTFVTTLLMTSPYNTRLT